MASTSSASELAIIVRHQVDRSRGDKSGGIELAAGIRREIKARERESYW